MASVSGNNRAAYLNAARTASQAAPAAPTTSGGGPAQQTPPSCPMMQQQVQKAADQVGGAAGGATAGAGQVQGNDLQSVLQGLVEVLTKLVDVLQGKSAGGGCGMDGPPQQTHHQAAPTTLAGGHAHHAQQEQAAAPATAAANQTTGVMGMRGEGIWRGSLLVGIRYVPIVDETAAAAPAATTLAQSAGTAVATSYAASEDHQFEQRVLELVNAERARYGLRPLSYNGTLDRAAEKHNVQQAWTNTMAHSGIGDGTPGDRVRAEGWRNSWGENVATGQLTPEQVVREWMASPSHRRNILDANFSYLGVSYTTSANGRTYWAQAFGA